MARPLSQVGWVEGQNPTGRLSDLNHLNGTLTSYNYDNANRLTDIQNTISDTSAIATYHFTLDDNGNRTGIDRIEPLIPLINIDTIDHTYNAEKNRLLTAGDSSFTYNFEGQLADIDGNSYTFDGQHRLISIGGPTVCRYFYNGNGNRLEAIRGGVTTRYIYDASGNLLAEADEHNTISRYYIHGLGLLAMVTPSDEVYCYHFNAIGSTIAMTDGGQEIVNKYVYTPFGIITNAVETMPQPFKYVGQHGVMTEPNSLQYMRARYYDSSVGRFISEDPLGFDGGDLNLYVYVGNNPLLFIDPFGLCEKDSQLLRDVFKVAEFSVRAGGVVIWETVKMVTMDSLKAYFIPRIPLTKAGGYAFGESVNLIQATLSLESYGNKAIDISNRIQTIRDDVFGPGW